MSLAPGWRRLFRLPRFSRKAIEQDVDDELAFHLAMRQEKLRRLGHSSASAQANAIARFGDHARVREECLTIDQQYVREMRFMEWVESILSDVRYALRTLRRAPAFAAVVVITLALGVGATTAMFSLVDGILLRPLPFPEPQRLVRVTQAYPEKGLDRWGLSHQNVVLYRDQVSDYASFAAYWRRAMTLSGRASAERVSGVRVTGDFFDVLGVKPVLGHVFGRDEDRPGVENVAVIGYGFWQSHFGGDAHVIGTVIHLDDIPTRVVAVMPRGFAFPRSDIQVYTPLNLDPSRRFGWFTTGIARLKAGVSVAHASSQTTGVMWNWARVNADLLSLASIRPEATKMHAVVVPLREAMTSDVARPLAVLQAAVVVLLLIAIANIATLLSSRSAARRAELAVRTALGATRARVARQLVTEAVVLAIGGGVLGIALATLTVRVFTRANAASLPRIDEVGVDWRVLGFALVVTIGSGILFGLSPVLELARSRRLADDLTGTHKQSARGAARRFNNALIVAQLALSVILLVSAGLVLKSVRQLLHTNLGFEPVGVTTVAIPLPPAKYAGARAWTTAFDQLVHRAKAVPGVRDAAAASAVPYVGGINTDGYLIEGRTPPANAGSESRQVTQTATTTGFFGTLGIPLRYGRDFNATDRLGSLPVVIVDDAFASLYWKGADALGKRMRLTGDTTWMTIVGVVGSVRDEDVAAEPRPHCYLPYAQWPNNWASLIVRSGGDQRAASAAIAGAIREFESGIPLDDIRPLTNAVSAALDNRRMTERLLGGFAALAVLLASVGIYGVMALYVANRQREFGIRLAIGAEPRSLVRLVLSEGFALAVIGVALGLVGALGATRWLRTLLYEVSPTDPVVFATLAIGLLGVAVASCYAPARRAAKADPLVALRAE